MNFKLKLINNKTKVLGVTIPIIVLYSKEFKDDKYFNCLCNFNEYNIKYDKLYYIMNYLFYRYKYSIIRITNNLIDTNIGDIIFIDKTININNRLYEIIFSKSVYLNESFKDIYFNK